MESSGEATNRLFSADDTIEHNRSWNALFTDEETGPTGTFLLKEEFHERYPVELIRKMKGTFHRLRRE